MAALRAFQACGVVDADRNGVAAPVPTETSVYCSFRCVRTLVECFSARCAFARAFTGSTDAPPTVSSQYSSRSCTSTPGWAP